MHGHALSYDDKLVISNKKWLNDNIIYIGQLLIKRLCPDTNGFTLLNLGKDISLGKPLLQFMVILGMGDKLSSQTGELLNSFTD